MKKIIYLIALISSTTLLAQQKFEALSENSARELADNLTGVSTVKQKLWRSKFNSDHEVLVISYIPIDLKNDDVWEIVPGTCEECTDVRFEVRGNTLTFYKYTGTTDKITAAWNKYFKDDHLHYKLGTNEIVRIN